ncbi:MAG: phosphoribosylglycinamide formyltransferase [Rikenellaceae bacterium]
MNNIAIFASGSGTNAENLILHFKGSKTAKVQILLSNKTDAFAIERARRNGVASLTFSPSEFRQTSLVMDALERYEIDVICLAGFLLLLPAELVKKYEGRIVNIHPSLLPSYGGKGMYGDNVHKAVVAARESETGITIHHVNEKFDDGDFIFQAKCIVEPTDDYKTVAQKVQQLEKEHFPKVVERFIEDL